MNTEWYSWAIAAVAPGAAAVQQTSDAEAAVVAGRAHERLRVAGFADVPQVEPAADAGRRRARDVQVSLLTASTSRPSGNVIDVRALAVIVALSSAVMKLSWTRLAGFEMSTVQKPPRKQRFA